MTDYHLAAGIPVVSVEPSDVLPWRWACPVPECDAASAFAMESLARHAWLDHSGTHDIVATWPDTSDIEITRELATTRIPAYEQAAMSDRPMSRPTE